MSEKASEAVESSLVEYLVRGTLRRADERLLPERTPNVGIRRV
jgi:hypothetical protein